MNTKISTKSELVGFYDMSSLIVWRSYFLKAHDYNVKETIPNKDTNITIILYNQGQASSSKHTKHINAI